MQLDYIPKNVRYWLLRQPAPTLVRWFDRLNPLLWQYPVRVSSGTRPGTLRAQDPRDSIEFVHPERVMRYARAGIRPFIDSLLTAYHIDQLQLNAGDLVIDCGANVGEVSMALRLRQPGLRIVAVEPEAAEADCADINVYGGQPLTLRKVLWREETTLRFFSAAQTADSSVFEPVVPHQVREISATTVDQVVASSGVERVRLLKLEAEGAEPEILEGARGVLSRIDYIAADLGPERGLKQEETATPVINHLLSSGFELVSMRFDRVTCLFRNRQLER